LIASVVSQLVMGEVSVSPYQQAGRRGHLERRFLLSLSSVIRADVLTVPPDATLLEFYEHHLLLTRETSVPVLDGEHYLGMISSDDLRAHAPETWSDAKVGDVADTQWPKAQPDWTLEMALRAMDSADVDALPVLDSSGSFIGIVTSTDIIRLDEILGSADHES
jgi:CBS domain-containing protein